MMVALWHVGVGTLSHRLAPGAAALSSRPASVNRFSSFTVKFLLTPDEHPTLTRLCTFTKIIDAMLTMYIIGLPQNVLKLEQTKITDTFMML